jgi:hypothetical protein
VYGAPQQSANSFSEENLIDLIRMGVRPESIAKLVREYGISFQPDEHTLEHLKKEGARDLLLGL